MDRTIITRAIRCPDCNSKEVYGTINQYKCLMCGKSFILQKRIFEGQINKAPTRYKNKKTHDEIMFEIRNK